MEGVDLDSRLKRFSPLAIRMIQTAPARSISIMILLEGPVVRPVAVPIVSPDGPLDREKGRPRG